MEESIDPAFGHWLAGFIDGEGSFVIIAANRGDHIPRFGVEVRADEAPIVTEIQERTGLGQISYRHRDLYPLKASPQVVWAVNRIGEQMRLITILETFPLRAKKSRDFEIWKEAVRLLAANLYSNRHDHATRARIQSHLGELRAYLRSQRAYRASDVPLPESPPSLGEVMRLFD